MLKFGQIVANAIGINNMPFDGHSNEKKNLLFMNKMLKFVLRLVYLIWHGIIAYLFMKKKNKNYTNDQTSESKINRFHIYF